MTGPSQAFQIGQEVEIIGPALGGIHARVGEKGKLSDIDRGDSLVSGLWYPASSLRLVEPELKIGDWVRIDNPEFKSHGEIFQISGVLLEKSGTYLSDAPNKRHFAECHLRKLTPEEVCHLKGIFSPEERLDSLEEYARESDARLTAIEKRLDNQKDAIIEMDLRLDVDGTDIKALAALAMLLGNGIGPEKAKAILEKFDLKLESKFNRETCRGYSLTDCPGVGPKLAARIRERVEVIE